MTSMKIKFLKLSFIMTIIMVVMSSCDSEVSPDSQPTNTTPFAMVYEDFITPNDIEIISNDTTYISVSSAYADKMGFKDF